METEKKFSKEFQSEILNLIEMCKDNNADGLTISLDYSDVTLEIEMNFKVKVKEYEA